METDIGELEKLLSMQESYFDNLIKLGLCLENSDQRQKAFEVYKKGLEKIEKEKARLSYTMLGLFD